MFPWGLRGVIVDDSTFYRFLKKGVLVYLQRNPEQKKAIEKVMIEIEKKYNDTNSVTDKVIQTLVFND